MQIKYLSQRAVLRISKMIHFICLIPWLAQGKRSINLSSYFSLKSSTDGLNNKCLSWTWQHHPRKKKFTLKEAEKAVLALDSGQRPCICMEFSTAPGIGRGFIFSEWQKRKGKKEKESACKSLFRKKLLSSVHEGRWGWQAGSGREGSGLRLRAALVPSGPRDAKPAAARRARAGPRLAPIPPPVPGEVTGLSAAAAAAASLPGFCYVSSPGWCWDGRPCRRRGSRRGRQAAPRSAPHTWLREARPLPTRPPTSPSAQPWPAFGDPPQIWKLLPGAGGKPTARASALLGAVPEVPPTPSVPCGGFAAIVWIWKGKHRGAARRSGRPGNFAGEGVRPVEGARKEVGDCAHTLPEAGRRHWHVSTFPWGSRCPWDSSQDLGCRAMGASGAPWAPPAQRRVEPYCLGWGLNLVSTACYVNETKQHI